MQAIITIKNKLCTIVGQHWLDGEHQKRLKQVKRSVVHTWHPNAQMCQNVKSGV